jgi:hypothetical protein
MSGSYVDYFEHYRDAEQHHVLFVVPSRHREDKLRQTIWRQRPRFRSDSCCSFWTTTLGQLRESGPLAAIWLPVDIRNTEPPARQDTRLRTRTALNQLVPVQPDARRGRGGEQPDETAVIEPIQLKPARIAPCSGEEWQRAIDLLAEISVPLLADRRSDERKAA